MSNGIAWPRVPQKGEFAKGDLSDVESNDTSAHVSNRHVSGLALVCGVQVRSDGELKFDVIVVDDIAPHQPDNTLHHRMHVGLHARMCMRMIAHVCVQPNVRAVERRQPMQSTHRAARAGRKVSLSRTTTP